MTKLLKALSAMLKDNLLQKRTWLVKHEGHIFTVTVQRGDHLNA